MVQLPLYSHGGRETCRSKGFPRPEWSTAQGEGEASELGQQSIQSCPCFCTHIRVWSSGSCSPCQEGMACHGGTVLVVASLWEWRLFTNSHVWHGLVVVIVAFVLVPISLGRSCDTTVWGSGCPSWATYSLSHGPVAPTSHGRVDGIGCGRFERS